MNIKTKYKLGAKLFVVYKEEDYYSVENLGESDRVRQIAINKDGIFYLIGKGCYSEEMLFYTKKGAVNFAIKRVKRHYARALKKIIKELEK